MNRPPVIMGGRTHYGRRITDDIRTLSWEGEAPAEPNISIRENPRLSIFQWVSNEQNLPWRGVLMETNEQTKLHRLALGNLIPPFELMSIDGKKYSPWDYKEKHGLVIIFFDPTKSSDLEALSEINCRYHEITDENAEVLAIGSGPGEQLNECIASMHFKFPILSDANGEAARAYGTTESMIYVVDKYGELKMQASISGDLDATLTKAIDALDLTELECPECGVTTWPES